MFSNYSTPADVTVIASMSIGEQCGSSIEISLSTGGEKTEENWSLSNFKAAESVQYSTNSNLEM